MMHRPGQARGCTHRLKAILQGKAARSSVWAAVEGISTSAVRMWDAHGAPLHDLVRWTWGDVDKDRHWWQMSRWWQKPDVQCNIGQQSLLLNIQYPRME